MTKTTQSSQPTKSTKPTKPTSNRMIWLLLVILVPLAVYAGYAYHKAQSEPTVEVMTRDSVITQIQEMSRLQTVAYSVDTIIATQKKGNWYALWQDEQKGLFVAHGKVLAGVDLGKLRAEDVVITPKNTIGDASVQSDADLSIRITLPAAEVFEVFLDNIEVYDLQTGLFNILPSDSNMLNQAQISGKSEVLKKACAGDVLELATQNARKQVTGLFEMTGAQITVTVKPTTNIGTGTNIDSTDNQASYRCG